MFTSAIHLSIASSAISLSILIWMCIRTASMTHAWTTSDASSQNNNANKHQSNRSSTEKVEFRLIKPQFAVAGCVTAFSTGLLIVLSTNFSTVGTNCKATAVVLMLLHLASKISVFVFLLEKAKVVAIGDQGKLIRWMYGILYVLFVCFALCYVPLMIQIRIVRLPGTNVCEYLVPSRLFLGILTTLELLIVIFSLMVFTKPLASVMFVAKKLEASARKSEAGRAAAGAAAEKQSTHKQFRNVIIKNFFTALFCMTFSVSIAMFVRLNLKLNTNYDQVIFISCLTQLDLICGLLSCTFLTSKLWFPCVTQLLNSNPETKSEVVGSQPHPAAEVAEIP